MLSMVWEIKSKIPEIISARYAIIIIIYERNHKWTKSRWVSEYVHVCVGGGESV